MTQPASDSLRDLVASTVREVVADMVSSSVRDALAGDPAAGTGPLPPVQVAGTDGARPLVTARPAPVRRTPGDARVETVRVAEDADLDAFARHLLELFENPKNRQDLRAGKYRFRLAQTSAARAAGRVRRIEQGAVTERQVKAAADAEERMLLGPRAVLTPLGREKARALGVPIEKER